MLTENMKKNLFDAGFGNEGLVATPPKKHRQQQQSTRKVDLIKVKTFCTSKDTTRRENSTCRIGENPANHVSEKGLIPRPQRELLQLNSDFF